MYRINNCTILTCNPDDQVISDGCIIVDDTQIVFVGKQDQAPEQPGCQVIDAAERIAMPGLINMHSHSPMCMFRGAADDLPLHRWLNEKVFPLEAKLDENSIYWGSMLAIAEMIRGGTTCFNDMYFMAENTVKAVEQTGISAVLSHCIAGQDVGIVSQKIRESKDFYTNYNGAADGRIAVSIAPHAEYTCSPQLLQACGETAQQLGALFHTHISETHSEHEECIQRHGKTPIELLESLGVLNGPVLCAHCVYISDHDMDIMAETNASVLHCPGSNLKLASGFARVPLMLQKGVNVTLGTDGAASNNNLSMFEEMQLSALVHKAVTQDATAVNAMQALKAATANGASALGWNTGIIAQGYLADIVLVDTDKPHMQPMHDAMNNIVYSAQFEDVYMTMARGKILYKNGEYLTFDIEKVLGEATLAAQKLV